MLSMATEVEPGIELKELSGVERETRVRKIVFSRSGKKYEYGYVSFLLPPEFIGRRVRVIVLDAESIKVIERK